MMFITHILLDVSKVDRVIYGLLVVVLLFMNSPRLYTPTIHLSTCYCCSFLKLETM